MSQDPYSGYGSNPENPYGNPSPQNPENPYGQQPPQNPYPYGAPQPPYGAPQGPDYNNYGAPPTANPLPLGEALQQLPNQYIKVLTKPSARTFAEEIGKASWDIVWIQ